MVPQRVPTRQPGTIPRSQQTKEVVADSRLADASMYHRGDDHEDRCAVLCVVRLDSGRDRVGPLYWGTKNMYQCPTPIPMLLPTLSNHQTIEPILAARGAWN